MRKSLWAAAEQKCDFNAPGISSGFGPRPSRKTVREWLPFLLPLEFRAWIATGLRYGSIPLVFSLQCAACLLPASILILASSQVMPVACELPTKTAPAATRTLAQHLGDTATFSPLWHRARTLGLNQSQNLLALAAQRGARHYAGLASPSIAKSTDSAAFSDEELIVLLLHGRNRFEPFLIRAAAELTRYCAVDPARPRRA